LTLLLATRSADKIREIRRILAIPGVDLLDPEAAGLPPLPEEDDLEPYDTFEENAVSKARYFWERSGIPSVADDSGIAVDALAGAPGVRSKRFAPVPDGTPGAVRDAENNAHLLRLLESVQGSARSARYVCVVALCDGPGDPLVLRAESEGFVGIAPRGDGGFGYDPLFVDASSGRTFAELSGPEKDSRSHRGAAFRQLAERLRALRHHSETS
jgi:XTP/dITP diphosphohydrolase